jgi:single-strand DNA-binding protein
MARSLNKVQLIGNLTRDPELRYTPNGNAVCSFSLATNRAWTTDSGEKREEADFHRIIAWNKLAELCSQFLVKGRKIYVEGRLSTRSWTGQDGSQKSTTEVVITDMILLDNKGAGAAGSEQDDKAKSSTTPSSVADADLEEVEGSEEDSVEAVEPEKKTDTTKKKTEKKSDAKGAEEDEVMPDDIPF